MSTPNDTGWVHGSVAVQITFREQNSTGSRLLFATKTVNLKQNHSILFQALWGREN